MYIYLRCCFLLFVLCSLLKKTVKNQFKEDFNSVFNHLSDGGNLTEDSMRSLMFGDYLVPDAVRHDSNIIILQNMLHTFTCTFSHVHVHACYYNIV